MPDTKTAEKPKSKKELERQRATVSAIYGELFLSRDEKLKEEVRPEIYHFFDRGADPDLLKDMLAEISQALEGKKN